MARGKAKIDSKIKAMKKAEKFKKKGSEKAGQEKGKKYMCKLCMVQVHNLNSLREHYDSRHPKVKFEDHQKETE